MERAGSLIPGGGFRMIAIFDEDGGGDVDFQEFVSGLSAFSSKGNKEQKLRFAFKVYDIDRDGYISNGELFIVLKMMVGSNLKDQQLQQVNYYPFFFFFFFFLVVGGGAARVG